jgi:hypothetical protein
MPPDPQLLKHGHFDTPQDLAEQMLAYIENPQPDRDAVHVDLRRQGSQRMSARTYRSDH